MPEKAVAVVVCLSLDLTWMTRRWSCNIWRLPPGEVRQIPWSIISDSFSVFKLAYSVGKEGYDPSNGTPAVVRKTKSVVHMPTRDTFYLSSIQAKMGYRCRTQRIVSSRPNLGRVRSNQKLIVLLSCLLVQGATYAGIRSTMAISETAMIRQSWVPPHISCSRTKKVSIV